MKDSFLSSKAFLPVSTFLALFPEDAKEILLAPLSKLIKPLSCNFESKVITSFSLQKIVSSSINPTSINSLFSEFNTFFIVSNITASESPRVLAASFEKERKLSVIFLYRMIEIRLSLYY